MKHYLHNSLRRKDVPIRICLIGCGATGSQVLSGLARMHVALKALGYAGFMVYVFDGDAVAQSNIGRQLYSPADMGRNKAEVFVTRVNHFFGLQWVAIPRMFTLDTPHEFMPRELYYSDLVITAVDTVAARVFVSRKSRFARCHCKYWLDIGNTKKTGQVILGTKARVYQYRRKDAVDELPTVLKLYQNIREEEKKEYQGPSCSIKDALEKQDLFVNQFVATTALQLLWNGIRQGYLEEHGAFINLDTLTVRPLPVDPELWARMMGTKKAPVPTLQEAQCNAK